MGKAGKAPHFSNKTAQGPAVGSDPWKDIVRDGSAGLGIRVSEDQLELFSRHAAELLAFNRKTNLTAIVDPVEIAVKHYVDSLAAAPALPDFGRMLDIGSGAGFPGIPLKIVRPDLETTLVDAVRRKVSFLNYVARILGLQGITAVHRRVEEMARDEKVAGGFDVVICRAFSSLGAFVRSALPLVAPDGEMIALKGDPAEAEMASLSEEGGVLDGPGRSPVAVCVVRYSLPFPGGKRALVRIRRR